MIAVNADACPKNHPCPAVHYCPAGAIVQENIFAAPRIDPDLCTECGVCTSVCGRVFKLAAEEVPVH